MILTSIFVISPGAADAGEEATGFVELQSDEGKNASDMDDDKASNGNVTGQPRNAPMTHSASNTDSDPNSNNNTQRAGQEEMKAKMANRTDDDTSDDSDEGEEPSNMDDDTVAMGSGVRFEQN